LAAGFVSTVQHKATQKGKMTFVSLDDMSDKHDLVLYGAKAEASSDEVASIEAIKQKLTPDTVMLFKVKVSESHFNDKVVTRYVIQDAYTWPEARALYASHLNLHQIDPEQTTPLMHILKQHAPPHGHLGLPIHLHYHLGDQQATLLLGRSWAIWPSDEAFLALETILSSYADAIQLSWP
jgi:DNA polymerase III alpha subunit